MNLPKTIVIAVNVHGGTDSVDNSFPAIRVPSKIKKLFKIDAVQWGNEIILNGCEHVSYLQTIKNELYKYHFEQNSSNCSNSFNPTNLESFVKQVVGKIKSNCFNKYQSKKNFNKHKTIGEEEKNYISVIKDKNYLKCVMSKNIYKINNLVGDEFTVNKIFCYDEEDIGVDALKYFNKISVLNVGYECVDLFDLMIKEGICVNYGTNGYETELKSLLEFLVSKQVENIVMFDFTCSSLLPHESFNNRHIRRFRREIYHGLNKKRTFENGDFEYQNDKTIKKIKK
jgi:hypothetical protein